MKVFGFSEEVWKICGIFLHENPSACDICLSYIVNFFILAILTFLNLFSFAFIVNGIGTVHPLRLVFAVLQIIAASAMTGAYCSLIFQKQKLLRESIKLNEIVNRRATHKNTEIYERAEKTTTKVAKWPSLILFVGHLNLLVLAFVGFTVRDLIRGELHTEDWFNVHELRFLFSLWLYSCH